MNVSYIEWLRNKIGNQKVFVPFASIVVRDEHNHILLQRRTDFDVWGLPGGVLELDEDIEGCARRELLEETGLTVGDLRLVGVYTDPIYDVIYPNGDQVQQFTICFEGHVNGGNMQHDGLETSDQSFVAEEDVEQFNIPIWYRDMIEDALLGDMPAFKQPRTNEPTKDQIAVVRPFIGTALYSGVGASAIIMDDDGRILMLQHKHETAWRPPAGFCNLGENVAQTAVREVWAETGLIIQPERLIGIHSTPKLNVTYLNGDRVRNVGIIFRAVLIGGAAKVDGHEIAEMAWMMPESALENFDNSRRWFFAKVLAHLDVGHFVY